MKLIIYNRSNSTSLVMLEPIASTYEVEPNTCVTVEGDFIGAPDGYGEIDINSGNHISLYMSLDTTVWKDSELLKPNPKY